jgi:hypothetical protein
MSWYDGVPGALLYAGPPSNYTAAAAASTSAQSLIGGASGNFSQPCIPFGFWQLTHSGQLILGTVAGAVTASTAATTMTIVLGTSSTSQSVSGGTATTIFTSAAVTINTTTASQGWEMDFRILSRGTGIGTTSASTTLLTSGALKVASNEVGCVAPVTVSTIDASVNQWLYATVTFSTSSTTNSCTLEQFPLIGFS